MLTIREIAERAGTSRGTVDRVLNGRGNVSPELENKIREIIAKENYQPNPLARALINSRKHTRIGVVIHSVGNPFFNDVLAGINSRAKKLKSHGLELAVQHIKGYSATEQIKAVEELIKQDIDGLIITPINVSSVKERLEQLTIPIVTLNTDIDINKLAFVGCDYYNNGRITGDMARLILSQGGNIAVVIGNFDISGHKQRVDGFEDSILENPKLHIVAKLENQDDDQVSYQLVKEYLAKNTPDLIYFGAAGIAGGIKAIIESGKQLPILTVDETEPVRDYLKQGIVCATVTQQPFAQGENSVRILHDFLTNKKAPRDPFCYTENQIKLKHSK